MAREIGAEDVLRHMAVPGEPNLYVIGCFERRVTLYSQQVRALNLVYALQHEKRLKPGDAVAVIGGGVAGMTAAAGAARLGYEVTLLEKGDVLLPLLRGNHTRWVYPHLYDWPEQGSERLDAGVPLLDWKAALAYQVADQLDAAWKELPELSRIDVQCNVRSIDLVPGSSRLTWNAPGPRFRKFAAVILTVGFGLERRVENTPWVSYWRDDALHQPSLAGHARHLISGCGDGGLIDLLRVRVRDFRHEHLIVDFLARVSGPTREKLLVIDEEARVASDPGEHLFERYGALSVPEVDDALGRRQRTDTTAVLNGRDPLPLTLGASILNRFLASRLLFRFGVEYRAGAIQSRPVEGRYEITFPSGKAELFDHVTSRHGTSPAALEESFPAVWNKCGPMRERSALDQTRWPIYGDAFDPVPSDGTRPPAPAVEPPPVPEPSAGARTAPFFGMRSDSLREGFKGREQDLALLHNALLGAGSVALRSHPGHVYAHGGGGIGKSRLAIEYAWRRRDDYPGGVFFTVVAARTPLAVLAGFGRQLFAGEDLTRDDDAAHRFAVWLADPSPGRRLLVLDDVQGSPEEVTRRLKERVEVRGQAIWPLAGLGHVTLLMTTRLRELPDARSFEVRQLDAKGALALLLDKAERPKPARAEKAAAKALADEVLGGHPLALSLAGAYVRRARLSFAEYRRLLEAKGVTRKLEEATRNVGYTIDDHEGSIATTYALSRDQLVPADPVDALGLRILTIAACLAPNVPIDKGLLRRMLDHEGAVAELDEIGLAESRLLDLSLLDADGKGRSDGNVAIHPLVADYTLSVLEERVRVRVQRAALGALRGLFPDHNSEYWRITQPNAHPDWEWLSPLREAHALAAWARAEPILAFERSVVGLSLGDLHKMRGDTAQALAAYRASFELGGRLVEGAPDNTGWRRLLFVSVDRIGDMLLAQGDVARALASYRTALETCEFLTLHDPSNARWQQDLAISHGRIGSILLAEGDAAGALASLRISLAINKRLAMQDPGNAEWQRALSLAYDSIGRVLHAQGDETGASTSHREALAIHKRLEQRDPDNALWQYEISQIYDDLGDILRAQGDRSGALTFYRDALVIAERLIQRDPSNAEWQTSLALYCYDLAHALWSGSPAELTEVQALVERGLRILRDLAAASRLTHNQQHKWLPGFEATLKAIQP
jgi:tetratricopeptide (TPR) repeat protein